MKKLVLFDFDGVIVDSFEMTYRVARKTDSGRTREQQKQLFDGNVYDEMERKAGKRITDEDDLSFYKEYVPPLRGSLKFSESFKASIL